MKMKIDQAKILIEKFIRRRMKAGDAGLRKKTGESRCWFDDSECRLIKDKIRQDISRFKGPIQNPSEFIERSGHRHILELIGKKENIKREEKYPIPKLDMKKDLELFLKSNGVEWLLSDWIFSNRQDVLNKRNKDRRGWRYIAKRLPGLPPQVLDDIYADVMLQLCESLRSGLWRGEHGAASILNYVDKTVAGIRAEYFEWENQQLNHRAFDLTQPEQKGAEFSMMAGPGREDPTERKSDPGGFGFWTKTKDFEDKQEKEAHEVFRTNYPRHFSDTMRGLCQSEPPPGRSTGEAGEAREDHWLDSLRGHDLKPCLFGGAPALAVEDEKFAEWQQSTYWQDPKQMFERKELHELLFNSSEYDPNKSYKENLRQAKKNKTLRFIGILKQKYGEDWDDKEIAEFWMSPKYEKREKDEFIKYVESFGLKYLGHKIEPKEIKADQIKGIIKRQKKLIWEDLKNLGYLRPITFRFPDRTSKLFYSPIKRTDKEKREPEIPRIGEFYFKGKAHSRPGFSFQRKHEWIEYLDWLRIKEELVRGVKEYYNGGGTLHGLPPGSIEESKFPKEKTGIYSKHYDLINKIMKLKKKHVSKYKVCVKCGRRERASKIRKIHGRSYCPACWKYLNSRKYFPTF